MYSLSHVRAFKPGGRSSRARFLAREGAAIVAVTRVSDSNLSQISFLALADWNVDVQDSPSSSNTCSSGLDCATWHLCTEQK
jgi:hypothetical protein